MKQILALFLLVFGLSLQAQEVISEVSEYIPYEDSLFVLKKTIITNNGLTALNDTVVTYSAPLDSVGLVNKLYTDHLNQVNRGAARWRANYNYRTILQDYSATGNTLDSLNRDLDSLVRNQVGQILLGRYRFFNDDGSDFYANLDYHPNRADLMRFQREDDSGFINATPLSRWLIRVVWAPGDIQYLFWDGVDSSKPAYRHGSANIPAAMVERDNRRIVKVN